ncbi:MAG TPA: alpha/beta hydrolase [Intrasporangium sp.]|uniref:alpha/beta fold hydrolase n=1 Tax=Intrasporangium sp. TaxID=1925024 RepID=UPI002B46DE9C|nr:alpha/beta hydrolase [Intrasporangium sp.]HKX68160.1 alpha/beta hydrolase [Intrasporangium sp.]
MSNQRNHYVTTSDGVTIGGTVHGEGAPLVFLQGAMGDGDLDWDLVLRHLTDQFTCHLPSLRGRGLSGDHPDLTIRRQVDDLLAYVDSIGAPTSLAGWSGGANHALGVAAQSDTVTSVVAFEPVVQSLMDEQEQAALLGAAARMGELATDGSLAEAARAFAGWPFNDQEVAAAEDAGYFKAVGRYVPNLLSLLQQLTEHGDPTTDPAVLGAISAPVSVLHGADTKPFFVTCARYVADHVTNGQVQEIQGAGHAAPLTHPEALADALTAFFASSARVRPAVTNVMADN